ncbi:ankyrin repeat [Fusarium sp. NRRL 52700]|nr:ankyrin repeat [Fusarium sp. NRRL 52700]
MADPLSMTASIAGVIALADLVFKTVFSYTYKAKEAKKDVESLKEEISGLSNALRLLDALAYELEAENGPRDMALNAKLLDQCRETLNTINQKVEKAVKDFEDARKWKSVSRQLKWPFSSSETKDLLDSLSRYKATVSMAASADSLSKLQTLLSQQVTHNTKIEELVQKVYQKSEITASILLDREKQRILDYFMKPNLNPQPSLDQSIKWRHPTTGNWLLSSTELQSWFANKGSLVWLNGIAGGGKTILAGLVIQEALLRSSPEVGVAFFFCDYKNPESLIPTKILGVIASQLALQNDESFAHLEEYFKKLCPSRALSKEPEVADLRDTIADMVKTFRQVLIIVDGLDECGDEMSSVTSCLSDLASLAEPATVALFSRNEMQIRSRMGKNFTEIPIEAHTEDIENYVRSELEQRIQSCRLVVRKSETKDAIQRELINRAHGMFRWVSCQLDYLCEFGTDHDRLQALKELPPTLPESYRRILVRLSAKPAKIRKMVQLCLHFIAFFPTQLTVLELCQAISTPDEIGAQLSEDNTYVEDDVILQCSSLIRKSADGRGFEFSHFTVQEFLETEMAGLEQYRISRPKSTSLMALNCLRFLQLKNINVSVQDRSRLLADLRKVDSSLPFYRHAAAYWPMLVREGFQNLDERLLLKVVEPLFCQPTSAKFRCWTFSFLRTMYKIVEKEKQVSNISGAYSKAAAGLSLDRQLKPLHLASALNMPEICLKLIDQGADPNATCHIGTAILLAESSILNIIEAEADEVCVDSDVLPLILSSPERRNSTIKCLISSGASLRDLLNYPSVFYSTIRISCHLQDFSPVVALLSNGITPTSVYIEEFGAFLNTWWSCCESRSAFESSFRHLHTYLRDTSAFDTEWGFEFGKMLWTRAVAMELSFTSDSNLTDTRISLSLETLREKIMLAMTNDDTDAFSNYLRDGRITVSDYWSWEDSPSQTLLHFATQFNASGCVSILLDQGSDPYARSDNGIPVLFEIDMTKDGSILDVFLEHKVSLLDTDASNANIWHVCASRANSSPSFMDTLFNARPEHTQAAVLTKTDNGDSPLTIALSTTADDTRGKEVLEENALSFITYCDHVPQFWEKHDPILPQAFKFGSEKVIHRLSSLGMRHKPFSPGDFTPLHELGKGVAPEWVRFLIATFPGAIESRFLDRLPVEIYANACVKSEGWPNEEVLKMLCTEDVLNNKDTDGNGIWEAFCCSNESLRGWEVSQTSGWSLVFVYSNYVSLGAMKAYEDVTGRCGPERLLSILAQSINMEHWGSAFNHWPEILDKAIVISKHWDPTSDVYVWVLKESVQRNFSHLVGLLLNHGVDVHQRVDGLSTIEYACTGVLATDLCSTPAGKPIMQSLLDHANDQKLTDFTPNETGYGLLHRIAYLGQEPQIRWLMQELVRRGVDINGINAHKNDRTRRNSPLVHHLLLGSTCYASYLLDMGADPSVCSNVTESINNLDAPSCAAFKGHLCFLEHLLTVSQEPDTPVRWTHEVGIYFPVGNDNVGMRVSSLHLASYFGYNEIVKFFIKNKLLTIDMTAKGGATSLHLAALGGQSRTIEYLMDQEHPIDVVDEKGFSPLYYAAVNGHLEATKTLLSKGARRSHALGSCTLKLAALEFGHQHIVELLDNELGCYNESGPDPARTQRYVRGLLRQMETAIASNNYKDCLNAVVAGCPLNGIMPRSNGYTPLLFALNQGRCQIVTCLLDHQASTLVQCHLFDGKRVAAIELAAYDPKLIKVLRTMIHLYTEQGGDLVNGPAAPIFFAAQTNVQGIRILLDYLQKHRKRWNQDNASRKEILDRRFPLRRLYGDSSDEVTALHVAVLNDNLAIAKLLLENGANIDSISASGFTTIEQSHSPAMTALLLRFGASRAPLLTLGLTGAIIYWSDEKLNSKAYATVEAEGCSVHVAYDKDLWLELDMPPDSILTSDVRHLLSVPYLRNILLDALFSHPMLGNYILNSPKTHCFLLNSGLHLDTLDHFPWYRIGRRDFDLISILGTSFRYFKRRFSESTLRRWMNLEPNRGWSPLCRAASLDLIEEMENCLSIGADIDFEGCSWGSALIIASACGRLDAVRHLVRAGAKIDYLGKRGHVSTLSVTESKVVRDWLLVGRFVEQPKIATAADCETSGTEKVAGRRSGTAKIKVRLAELYYRRYEESSLDYAKRLGQLKHELRGKVPYYFDGVVYSDDRE